MSLQEYLNLINFRKKTVILITAIIFIAAAIVTFVQPLKYSSESKILIINYNTDSYSMGKSNEYVVNVLAQSIHSDYFFQDLKNSYSDSGINWEYFGDDNQEQLKTWSDTTEVSASIDNNFIEVAIYHPDKDQVQKIAKAVNETLIEKNQLYHGLGDRIKLKIIDNSLISKFPVKPNIPLNLGLGFILGLLLGLIYVYLFPERSYFGQNLMGKIHKKDQYVDLTENTNQDANDYLGEIDFASEAQLPENEITEEQNIINDNTQSPAELPEAPANISEANDIAEINARIDENKQTNQDNRFYLPYDEEK